jgi:hypothetical protein
MEEAIEEFSKRFVYYDYFHKVPWIWGARKIVILNRKPSSLLPKYSGFCSMIALNFLFCGCMLSILLRKLLGSDKDPELSIVEVFLLLLAVFICMMISSLGRMIILHSNLMGSILFQFRITKGTCKKNA